MCSWKYAKSSSENIHAKSLYGDKIIIFNPKMQKMYVVLKYWWTQCLLEQSCIIWLVILDEIKIVNIQLSRIFEFLLWYPNFTIPLLDLLITRTLPLSLQVMLMWPDFGALNLSCNDIGMSKHNWKGAENMWYRDKDAFLRPATSFAVKQDIFF